jgi:hypothetical protein
LDIRPGSGGARPKTSLIPAQGNALGKSNGFSLKTNGLSHIKKQGEAHGSFFWQRGQGAFSVGFSQLDSLLHYIDTQAEHHRTKTFQEEYRELAMIRRWWDGNGS